MLTVTFCDFLIKGFISYTFMHCALHNCTIYVYESKIRNFTLKSNEQGRSSTPALKPGRVIRVTFSPGHPGLTRFTIYPGLTRIGSREKRNCSFDDVELINAIA